MRHGGSGSRLVVIGVGLVLGTSGVSITHVGEKVPGNLVLCAVVGGRAWFSAGLRTVCLS